MTVILGTTSTATAAPVTTSTTTLTPAPPTPTTPSAPPAPWTPPPGANQDILSAFGREIGRAPKDQNEYDQAFKSWQTESWDKTNALIKSFMTSPTIAPVSGIQTLSTANVPTTGTFNPQSTNFASMLQQMFAKFANPSQFSQTQQTVAAPTWTPGMNPFATTAASVTAPTFTGANPLTGAYTPQTAPTLQTATSFQAPTNPIGSTVQSSLSDWLANPSSFNSPEVEQSYNYLSQGIDDQFSQQQQLLEEDMAKRGLAASSIRGGRLSDLNVGRKSAKENLANSLLTQQATTQSQARAAAIAAAMGYGGQEFSQALGANQANASNSQQNFLQDLSARAFAGDQQAQALLQQLNTAQFNSSNANTGFQNQLASSGFTAGQNQQQFQNALASSQFNTNTANTSFQNQLAAAGFTADQNQQGTQNALQAYLANQAGNNQSFTQQQQLLGNMLGYDQQSFQNQLATYNANQSSSQWYQQLLAWLASQGAQAPGVT